MRVRIAVIVALLATGLVAPSTASAIAFAVTDTAEPSLVMFDPARPGQVSSSTPLTGLSAGETVRGLDLRPTTGALYLLTTDVLGTARLRTVDPDSAAVTAPISLSADPADSTNPYAGTNLGNGAAVDFNPVSDRLRIVGPSGDNLRVNPANGFVTTDSAINGSGHTYAGAAYTNNFSGATTTTLYDVDYTADQLTIQNPPNDGTIVPVGSLGIIEQGTPNVAFDIAPAGTAYLAARVGGSSSLYTVNLTTGAATLIGGIGGGTLFRGFTIAENLIRRTSATTAATEGPAVARVIVERSSPRLGASVDYATVDGSAVAGADYEARAGTLTFVPGELAKLIEIRCATTPWQSPRSPSR